MAISLLQSTSVSSGAVNTGNLAFLSNNTAGSLLTCCIRYGPANATVGVTDSQGNTWVKADDLQATNQGVFLFYAKNCAAGANTVTVTGSGTATSMRIAIGEYSGADTVAPLDVTTTATATNTAIRLPVTTLSDGSVLVIAYGTSATSVASGTAGYTVEETLGNLFGFADGFGSGTAGSETGSVNLVTSVTWTGVMAVFRPPAPTSPDITLVPDTKLRVYEFVFEC